jgi:hypothetical protein
VSDRHLVELDRVIATAHAAIAEATRRVPVVEVVRLVAGVPVRFRVAGAGLAEHLLAPFEHLPASSAPPSFTACAWDSGSSGVDVPLLADAPSGPAPTRSVIGRMRAASSSTQRAVFEGYDGAAATGWFAIGDVAGLTTGERGAPFRLALHWWLTDRRVQFAHGAAVGVGGTAVLVAGPTGAGKSSTALACAEDGFDYLADDYCAVQTSRPPVVHGLYSSAKVVSEDVDRFPKLAAGTTPPHNAVDDKALVLVHRALPAQVVTEQVLGAIVVPSRSRERATTFTRVSSGTGLHALAPSTIGQFPGGAATALAALAALARSVPAYRLDVGAARTDVPSALRALIGELESAP